MNIKSIFRLFLFFCFIVFMVQRVDAQSFNMDIPSSMNPVGSGARALGMGGAFIGVADDATAASWNPGGLIQLETKECSVVVGYFSRSESNDFKKFESASGDKSVDNFSLNYLSYAYPFEANNLNMIVSLNYQRLYEFNRDWKDLLFAIDSPDYYDKVKADYEQKGALYALGLAFGIQLGKRLSTGITLNFWDDLFNDNEWEQTSKTSFPLLLGTDKRVTTTTIKETYDFKGFNTNLGFLFRLNEEWQIGGVLKTPFKAKIERRKKQIDHTIFYEQNDQGEITQTEQTIYQPEPPSYNDELAMPMSYGIGTAYRIKDSFTMSFDIYRTNWDELEYHNENGKITSAISGRPIDKSEIDPTTWFRAGMEYLVISEQSVIPIRAGIFYDPAPSEGESDKYFGITFGSGYGYEFKESNATIKSLIFDIAYQYRFGREVNKSLLEETLFSQDINEHTINSSLIVHF